MSSYDGELINQATGHRIQVYRGFSWPAFFFGALWFIAKGMIGTGLVLFMIAVFTAGFGWLLFLFILPFVANNSYQDWLSRRGYHRPEVFLAMAQQSGPAGQAAPNPLGEFSLPHDSNPSSQHLTSQRIHSRGALRPPDTLDKIAKLSGWFLLALFGGSFIAAVIMSMMGKL